MGYIQPRPLKKIRIRARDNYLTHTRLVELIQRHVCDRVEQFETNVRWLLPTLRYTFFFLFYMHMFLMQILNATLVNQYVTDWNWLFVDGGEPLICWLKQFSINSFY